MIFDWNESRSVVDDRGTFMPELTRRLPDLVVVDEVSGEEIQDVLCCNTTTGELTRIKKDAEGNPVMVPRYPGRAVRDGEGEEMWLDRATEIRKHRVVSGEEWEKELAARAQK